MADLVRELTDDMRYSRRALARASVLTAGGLAFAIPGNSGIARASRARGATPVAGSSPDEIVALVQGVMDACDLRVVILHVVVDGDALVTEALGESMTGEPATIDMRFRNGAVAISLMSTPMLTLVDDGTIGLDDPIAAWLPDLPDADTVPSGCWRT